MTKNTLVFFFGAIWLLMVFFIAHQQSKKFFYKPSFIYHHPTTQQIITDNKNNHSHNQNPNPQDNLNHPQEILLKSDIANTQNSVHAPTLAYINRQGKHQLMSAWFEGSREGAKDVKIYASFLDLEQLNHNKPLDDKLTNSNSQSITRLWSPATVILSPQQLAAQSHTYIKKLGNPVLYQSADGIIHLFVVATSYGGWAASKIYHLTSIDGKDFIFKQVLALSPFLNVSHLIRTVPISLSDGGFYLPIYHELLDKFEIILRFDKNANLIAKIRPNTLTGKLQPAIAPLSPHDCLSASRHSKSENLLIQRCYQGGLQWDKAIETNIKNDNNSLNLIHHNHNTYLIHNQPKNNNSRYYLWLSKINSDNLYTTPLFLIDHTDTGEVSYPSTLMVDNHLHIVYTHDRNAIRHIMINDKLLDNINQQSFSHCITQDKQTKAQSLKTNSQLFNKLVCKEKVL